MRVGELIQELQEQPQDADVSEVVLKDFRAVRVHQMSTARSIAAYDRDSELGLSLAAQHLKRLDDLLEQGRRISAHFGVADPAEFLQQEERLRKEQFNTIPS